MKTEIIEGTVFFVTVLACLLLLFAMATSNVPLIKGSTFGLVIIIIVGLIIMKKWK